MKLPSTLVGLLILGVVGSAAAQAPQVAPRQPVPKIPNELLRLPDLPQGVADPGPYRLIVKFRDDLKVRATAEGRALSGGARELAAVDALTDQLGLRFDKAIKRTDDVIAGVEAIAQVRSGRAQPDIAGIMFVDYGDADVLEVARTLNLLPEVEYVEIEPFWVPDFMPQDPEECGDPEAEDCFTAHIEPFCDDLQCCLAVCQIDPDCCADQWSEVCAALATQICDNLPPLECGSPQAGSCFQAHGPFEPYCDNTEICECVCALDPECCDSEWDQVCADIAAIVCGSAAACVPEAGDCFTPHDEGFGGCEDDACCNGVCDIDPYCCADTWDQLCVGMADQLCSGVPTLCGSITAGPCFDTHVEPYCDHEPCCVVVCAIDPDCCNVEWDQQCVDLATSACFGDIDHECGDATAGDCFSTHAEEEPGCDDTTCCTIVCGIDPYCCSLTWDSLCADVASQLCAVGPLPACGAPNALPCETFDDPLVPGCEDETCCTYICTIEPLCCDEAWDERCAALAEILCGIGQPITCANPDFNNYDCFRGGCDDSLGCLDPACCAYVCAARPFCCDVNWDALCAEIANFYCAGGTGLCGSIFSGPCLEENPSPGCSTASCCEAVCAIEPLCCDAEEGEGWDEVCVEIAEQICEFDPDAQTPDFRQQQGYQTLRGYSEPCPPLPPSGVSGLGIGHAFYSDEYVDGDNPLGYDLDDLDTWPDDEDDAFYEGLFGLARWFQKFEGKDATGEGLLVRGKTIRIGVIEHSAHVIQRDEDGNPVTEGHEDLTRVFSEPGQTLLLFEEGNISANHGTASLGIVAGDENGFGITAVATDADPYFFPIVSVEEGGRTQQAMFNAIEAFTENALEPNGDVLSFSFGPAGCGTLVSSPTEWILVRTATDLGITCVISAGNDCCNLDENDTLGGSLGDSGAIVVGAGGEGTCGLFARLGFSNHGDCPTDRVHCQSWGGGVMSTGYGDAFNPGGDAGGGDSGNSNRQYTYSFGGTSTAAPIIAGLCADLQGMAKQMWGFPVSPAAIRGIVSGNGYLQCGAPCSVPDFLGAEDGLECFGDVDPDEDANVIGLFPDGRACGFAIATGSWFDTPSNVTRVDILKGELLNPPPNLFRYLANDDVTARIRSQPANPGSSVNINGPTTTAGGGLSASPIGSIVGDFNFLAAADITSMLVIAEEPEGNDFIDTGVAIRDEVFFVEFFIRSVQVWNNQPDVWEYVGFDFDNDFDVLLTSAQRYWSDHDNDGLHEFLLIDTVYSFGGLGSGGAVGHDRHIDLYSVIGNPVP